MVNTDYDWITDQPAGGVMLIWRCRTLGDPILGLPALHSLRAQYPDARLAIVGYPDVWELAASAVNDVLSIEAPPFDALLGDPVTAKLPSLHDVDLAVALTSLPVRPFLEAAGVARVVQRSPVPPPGVHAADWLLDAVRGQAGARLGNGTAPALPQGRAELDSARQILGGLGLDAPIILHPGSSECWKRWPAARYARLADALAGAGHQVAMVAGAADRRAVETVASHARSRPAILPLLPLRSLAAVLAHARLFVGNDSGATHLAAAVGAPTVALFGPTDPVCWAPRGNVCVIRACRRKAARRGQIRVCDAPDCMGQIEIDDVLDGIHGQLDRIVPTEAGPWGEGEPASILQ